MRAPRSRTPLACTGQRSSTSSWRSTAARTVRSGPHSRISSGLTSSPQGKLSHSPASARSSRSCSVGSRPLSGRHAGIASVHGVGTAATSLGWREVGSGTSAGGPPLSTTERLTGAPLGTATRSSIHCHYWTAGRMRTVACHADAVRLCRRPGPAGIPWGVWGRCCDAPASTGRGMAGDPRHEWLHAGRSRERIKAVSWRARQDSNLRP